MNERLEWIDISKGILIFFIVLMHIDYWRWNDGNIGEYIYDTVSLFKVSAFFVLSGFLINDKKIYKIKDFIKHKIKTLYMKVFLISTFAVIMHNLFIKINFYKIGFEYSGKIMYEYSLNNLIKNLLLSVLCAGREVIIGPIWFGNVLFLAIIIYSIITFIIYRLNWFNKKEELRLLLTFLLMIISGILTNINDVNIPRFNNTLTAVFLICVGHWLYEKLLLKFNNTYVFIASFIMILNCSLYGVLSLNQNIFRDPAFLIAVSISGSYIICYLAKVIENIKIFKIIKICGEYSFYIMAFQLISFKFGILIINLVFNKNIELYLLTPKANNIFEMIYYLICGLFIPIFFISGVRNLILVTKRGVSNLILVIKKYKIKIDSEGNDEYS